MPTESPVPKDAPVMAAWDAYKATPEYENTRNWARKLAHTDGSLWAAFYAGFMAKPRACNFCGVAQADNPLRVLAHDNGACICTDCVAAAVLSLANYAASGAETPEAPQ